MLPKATRGVKSSQPSKQPALLNIKQRAKALNPKTMYRPTLSLPLLAGLREAGAAPTRLPAEPAYTASCSLSAYLSSLVEQGRR